MIKTLQEFLTEKEKIIGLIASVLAIIMFVSLIEVILENLRGESQIVVQPAATALNGFFWSLYAFGKKDWFLLSPNILACVLGIITALSAYL